MRSPVAIVLSILVLAPAAWLVRGKVTALVDAVRQASSRSTGWNDGALTGVVRLHGAPVEGAEVILIRHDDQGELASLVARTDREGRYRLGLSRAPYWELRARYQGYRALWPGPHPTQGVADFELRRPWAIEGRVVDEQGRSVRGETVCAAFVFDSCTGSQGSSARTDWSGRFRIELLEPGRYDLRVDAVDYLRLDHPGIDLDMPEDVPQVELVLRRAAKVAGIAVHPDGAPAAGARISHAHPARSSYFYEVADDQGRFELERVPRDGGVFRAERPEGEATRTAEKPPSTELRLEVPRAPPPRKVEGIATDHSGRPLAGLEVRLDAPGAALWQTTRTGEDGRFRYPGTHQIGWHNVSVFHEALELTVLAQRDSPAGAPLRFVVPKVGPLLVRVQDSDGRPVEGAEVSARTFPGYGGTESARSQRTGPTGEALLTAVPHLRVDLRIEARAHRSHSQVHHLQRGKESVRVILVADPRAFGRVVDSEGRPIRAFAIDRRQVESPDGSFEHLLNGSLRFSISAPGFVPRVIRLPDGATRVHDLGAITLRPERLGSLHGRMVTPEGRSIPGAQVAVATLEEDAGPGGWVARQVTDDLGRFTFSDLPGPEVWMEVTHPLRVSVAQRAKLGPTPIELVQPRGATVRVRVEEDDGERVYSELRIAVGDVEHRSEFEEDDYEYFRRLPAGPAQLLIEPVDGPPLPPRLLALTDGQTHTVLVKRGEVCEVPLVLGLPAGVPLHRMRIRGRRLDLLDARLIRSERPEDPDQHLARLVDYGWPMVLQRGFRYRFTWEHVDVEGGRGETSLDLSAACPPDLRIQVQPASPDARK